MKVISRVLFAFMILSSLSHSTLALASIKFDDGGVCPTPNYPKVSINRKEEGLIEFSIHINESGRVTAIKIIKSSGFKNLDDATEKNFKRCKFPPKRLVSPDKGWVKNQAFIWRMT